jgi:hypothetical protein
MKEDIIEKDEKRGHVKSMYPLLMLNYFPYNNKFVCKGLLK